MNGVIHQIKSDSAKEETDMTFESQELKLHKKSGDKLTFLLWDEEDVKLIKSIHDGE